jgi:hypothetical protein
MRLFLATFLLAWGASVDALVFVVDSVGDEPLHISGCSMFLRYCEA